MYLAIHPEALNLISPRLGVDPYSILFTVFPITLIPRPILISSHTEPVLLIVAHFPFILDWAIRVKEGTVPVAHIVDKVALVHFPTCPLNCAFPFNPASHPLTLISL